MTRKRIMEWAAGRYGRSLRRGKPSVAMAVLVQAVTGASPNGQRWGLVTATVSNRRLRWRAGRRLTRSPYPPTYRIGGDA